MVNNKRLEEIILAILTFAKSQGRNKILRTELMKFLYLSDVYAAEASADQETMSGLEWKFLHFGPFSQEVASSIDNLASRGMLSEEIIEAQFSGDKEYKLYSIPDYSSPSSLVDLGAPPYVQLRLSSDMKRCETLSSLLNYIYFETTPMLDAKPSEILNFKNCKKNLIVEFKPIQMKPLDKKKIADNKNKLRELIKKKKSKMADSFNGKYDDVYNAGIAALESEPVITGLKGRAFLEIKK